MLNPSLQERILENRLSLLQRNERNGYGAHMVRAISHIGYVVFYSSASLASKFLRYPFLGSTGREIVDSIGIILGNEVESQDIRRRIREPEIVKRYKPEIDPFDFILQSNQETEDLWHLTRRTNPNMINVFSSSDVDFFRFYNDLLESYGVRQFFFQLESGKKSFTQLCPNPPYLRAKYGMESLARFGLVREHRSRDILESQYEMVMQQSVSGAITACLKILEDTMSKERIIKGQGNINRIISLKGELLGVVNYLEALKRVADQQQKDSEKSLETSNDGAAGI